MAARHPVHRLRLEPDRRYSDRPFGGAARGSGRTYGPVRNGHPVRRLIRIGVLGPNRRPAFLLAIVAILAQVAAAFALQSPPPGEGLPVRIVQPNIGQEQKWSPIRHPQHDAARPFVACRRVRTAASDLARGGGDRAAPGRAPARRLSTDAESRARFQAQTDPDDLLLTGGISVQSSDGVRRPAPPTACLRSA
jgi:hypothetical protein